MMNGASVRRPGSASSSRQRQLDTSPRPSAEPPPLAFCDRGPGVGGGRGGMLARQLAPFFALCPVQLWEQLHNRAVREWIPSAGRADDRWAALRPPTPLRFIGPGMKLRPSSGVNPGAHLAHIIAP